ncbi:MAG TPA: helix-turn-helix domain-containing protein, partial [Alphaproteobacteria bacterium]|nr:helix-turn-helix domain-containing protein [Alphaproteobacteria bacterium]
RPSAEAPSAAQRVYRELARLARPHPSGDGSWVISPMPLHRDIAAATGTAPEDVAQAIGHLMRSGAIRRRNLDIILLDRRGVQELAAQR